MTRGLPGGAAGHAPDPPDLPDTVDEVVAHLRDDPVLVAEMLGNGRTAEVSAHLRDLAGTAAYPVHVVLTRTPTGMDPSFADEELASLLHARLGEDGVYYVHTSLGYGHIGVWGDLDPSVDNDETLLSLARHEGVDQVRDALTDRWGDDVDLSAPLEAAVVLEVAQSPSIPEYDAGGVLDDEQVATYTSTTWRSVGYDSGDTAEPTQAVGLATMLGVAVALVLGFLVLRRLRTSGVAPARASGRPATTSSARASRPSKPSKPSKPVARPVVPALPSADETRYGDPATLREEARAALDELTTELESPRAARLPAERVDVAVGSREVGLELLAGAGGNLDLVGALVLARTGLHALRATRDDAPYRCCVFDPRHGAGRRHVDLGDGVRLPACAPCRRDVAEGRTPQQLWERRPGRDRPYLEGRSVWARTGFGTLTDQLWRDVREDRR